MKKYSSAFNLIGVTLIFGTALFIFFCYMSSDPEIEGESGRTPLRTYLLSLIPLVLGIIILMFSNGIKEKKN